MYECKVSWGIAVLRSSSCCGSILFKAVKLDHATVRVTAINCIIDAFVIFGLHPFLEVAEKFDEVDLDIGGLFLVYYPVRQL